MAGRKQDFKNRKTVTVVFVEGDADELIIGRLLDYYREKGWRCQGDLMIKNTNGFPNEKKMKSKLTQIQQTTTKMQVLFNTIHKGKAKIKPIIDKLDMGKIREARKKELKDFDKLLGVELE